MKVVRALSLVERLVLRSLRSGMHLREELPGAALRTLALEAVAAGQTIRPPEAPFVSTDERRLLGLLALSQRRLRRPWAQIALAEALLHAAATLSEHQVWLPVASGVVGEDDVADLDLVKTCHGLPRMSTRGSSRELTGTLRGRVIAALRDHGSLFRHELVRLGLSRQYLHHMVQDGTLVATATGRYQLSPQTSRDST